MTPITKERLQESNEALTQKVRERDRNVARLQRELIAERDAAMEAGVIAGLEAAAELADSLQPCATCGHPKSTHPYQHPFLPSASVDVASNIRAINPQAIAPIQERGLSND